MRRKGVTFSESRVARSLFWRILFRFGWNWWAKFLGSPDEAGVLGPTRDWLMFASHCKMMNSMFGVWEGRHTSMFFINSISPPNALFKGVNISAISLATPITSFMLLTGVFHFGLIAASLVCKLIPRGVGSVGGTIVAALRFEPGCADNNFLSLLRSDFLSLLKNLGDMWRAREKNTTVLLSVPGIIVWHHILW